MRERKRDRLVARNVKQARKREEAWRGAAGLESAYRRSEGFRLNVRFMIQRMDRAHQLNGNEDTLTAFIG